MLHRKLALFALAAIGAAAWWVVGAIAQPAGEVGGKPFVRPPVDEGRRISPALIIGLGEAFDGPIQLVAFGWKAPADEAGGRHQYCVWIESPPLRTPNFGACRNPQGRLGNGQITIDDMTQQVRPKSQQYTEVGGALAPDVDSVLVTYKSPAGNGTVPSTVGQVKGTLRLRLKQRAPFGFYVARIPGLVKFQDIRVTALDAKGEPLASV
jgi:hypothetical protein